MDIANNSFKYLKPKINKNSIRADCTIAYVTLHATSLWIQNMSTVYIQVSNRKHGTNINNIFTKCVYYHNYIISILPFEIKNQTTRHVDDCFRAKRDLPQNYTYWELSFIYNLRSCHKTVHRSRMRNIAIALPFLISRFKRQFDLYPMNEGKYYPCAPYVSLMWLQ